ncbi:helix-turn-helix domain-containing protein [Catenuloplanes atrovinosus]|uniref:Transcriptional regulator with XRE-family HTH domain n=1 Tax=Catenuloplanes atrovinosus TaxID=137266 RepID=A0AAE3YU12_9ACTN|nr:helix-turn-helix transcriptional regulator [Catenuloplanes atrovinosus]MDR7278379.1 transcriptional regulator with XRE-family HTH domain [Catenuloplanes atrovinosus]
MGAPHPEFGAALRQLVEDRRLSYRELSRRAHFSTGYISDLINGRKPANADVAKALDKALDTGGRLTAMIAESPREDLDDELDAWELLRRIEASDVGAETLGRLEKAVDEMAMRYATDPPEELLPRVRHHLGYVVRLVGARATLHQRQRILVSGAWLSLLAATLHIDLQQRQAARARLGTARTMAEHVGHDEIRAWCLETRAWEVLTTGDFAAAAALSRQAQAVAPRGGSVLIQATAQEGRAWARMGRGAETREALGRVERLVAGLARPDRPEHHYQYDPAKAESYSATTLAWAGDAAAVGVAQTVIESLRLEGARPRRMASAQLDLSLALLAAEKHDEAAAHATEAITSGRIVASNWWRATEILKAVDPNVAEAATLREAYQQYRPAHHPGTA